MTVMTIPEAASALGLSESSIRRRIKMGRLSAERRETPQGYVWLVQEPIPAPSAPDLRDHYIAHLEDEVTTLRRIVESLLERAGET